MQANLLGLGLVFMSYWLREIIARLVDWKGLSRRDSGYEKIARKTSVVQNLTP